MNFNITAPPGQPSIPTIESANDTWAFISWNPPLVANSPISYYEIIVQTVQTVDDGAGVIMVTNSNVTSFNVTGLLPGMAYELAVVAVSEDGNTTAKSPESESAVLLGFIRTSMSDYICISTNLYIILLYIIMIQLSCFNQKMIKQNQK